MTQNLQLFFKEIATNKNLQKRLYSSKEVADVAVIAGEFGFEIAAAEVLKAQAGRLIELSVGSPEEAKIATAGNKPNLGAQWGREGKGFLENAGYWIIEIYQWGTKTQSFNSDISNLFLKLNEDADFKFKVNSASTIDDVVKIAHENGLNKITSLSLLTYQALCILLLSDEKANLVARGA